jgi:hypothetical protein
VLTRPLLHTSYRSDMALWDSWTKRVAVLGLLALLGVMAPSRTPASALCIRGLAQSRRTLPSIDDIDPD